MHSVNFKPIELSAAQGIAFRAAEKVAPTLRESFGKTPHQTKTNERNWVTQWDKWADKQILAELARFSSDVGFLSEESGVYGNREVYWTVDSIDDTAGYVRGIDNCTSMISLVDSGVPVASIIYDFIRNIPFTAIAGGGAFRNVTERMKVSERDIRTAYIETYVPLDTEIGAQINARIREAGAFILQTAAAGSMFSKIARGASEGFVSFDNPYASIWDYAPGALLVHEAGGKVANVSSDTYTVDNPNFIASNKPTFQVLSAIAQSL